MSAGDDISSLRGCVAVRVDGRAADLVSVGTFSGHVQILLDSDRPDLLFQVSGVWHTVCDVSREFQKIRKREQREL